MPLMNIKIEFWVAAADRREIPHDKIAEVLKNLGARVERSASDVTGFCITAEDGDPIGDLFIKEEEA